MKKFYSIIACALMGSALTASAVQLPSHTKELKNAPLRNILELRTPSQEIKAPSVIEKSISGVVSRDDDDWDPCTFSQCLYFDYFFNWKDGDKELNEFRNLQSSTEVDIVDNGDGTMSIKDFFGVSVFTPTLYIENNELVMHLGEELYRDSYGQRYILASVNEIGNTLVTGTLALKVYLDAIECEDFLGVYVVGPEGGWYVLSLYTVFVAPNATLKYSFQQLDEMGYPVFDEDGNPKLFEVNNKVYTEYRDASPENNHPYDEIWISNVMPWNSGVGVSFSFYDEDGLDLLVAFDQIVLPSEWNGKYYSGDFYLCGSYSQLNQFDTNVLADTDADAMYWPGKDESIGIYPDQWMALALDSGDFYPPFDPATLIFSVEEGEDGIIDINQEEYDGAPVYYNIQGMRIANPEAGQFCIVKEGSKTTKTIIR